MKYLTIADGQLKVSRVCLGCWALVGDATWGTQEKADALAAIRGSLEAGVNFLDTAEGYGHGLSEQLIGEAIGTDRAKVVLASKVGGRHMQENDVVAACEESLKNLRTDYLDIYYIHWPSRTVPQASTLAGMERLKKAGKIRHLAVSNYGRQDLAGLLPAARPVMNQLPYSLLWRALEFEILPACRQAGVPVVCYSPLMQGLLTGKFKAAADVPDGRARTRLYASTRSQARHGEAGAETLTFATLARIAELARQAGLDMAQMALAWLLAQEGVAAVVAGARDARQAKHNAAAADLALPPDLVAQLAAATEPLRQRLGTNPDMWQADSRLR